MPKFIIMGCGGTGRTAGGVLDSRKMDYAYLDDAKKGKIVNGKKVLGGTKDFMKYRHAKFLVGFGTTFMKERAKTFNMLKAKKIKIFNAIHKSAAIDKSARAGEGNIIAANCVMNPNSSLGDNNVICAASTIDHDVVIGNHCYISPGVNIAGAAVIGDGAFIGTNATILPTVKIGSNSIVGAGSVVLKSIPKNVTVVGVPARIIKRK
ncbi:MAG: acetyltransferase [Nanoarchaeota archaeon]|nr:MAG: acetyltransferase [Nanoarchaeota archaeon]